MRSLIAGHCPILNARKAVKTVSGLLCKDITGMDPGFQRRGFDIRTTEGGPL